MSDQREKEGRTLDAVVELAVEDGLPSAEEAFQGLLAAGLEPEKVGRALRERLVAATWKNVAQERMRNFQANTRQRPVRPSDMSRQYMLDRIQSTQPTATALFRNADKMSDDDLWNLLCDLESGDDA